MTRQMDCYFQKDEALYVSLGYSHDDAPSAAASGACLAEKYRDGGGKTSAELLARSLGVKVETDSWAVADDKVMMLGECSWQPSVIRVNARVVKILLEEGRRLGIAAECIAPDKVREAVIGHELYHVIARESGGELVELAAHSFSRALVGLEFSPLLFNRVLSSRMAQQAGTNGNK